MAEAAFANAMNYVTPNPPLQSFTDPAQQHIIRRLRERLDLLEAATNLQSFTDGRNAPAPPKAQLSVTANPKVPGHLFVRITNPEFLLSKGNSIAAPIRHWLRASSDPGFKRGIVDFPISHQTYFTISELGSGTFHFELRSTQDGKTFNSPVRSGPVSA